MDFGQTRLYVKLHAHTEQPRGTQAEEREKEQSDHQAKPRASTQYMALTRVRGRDANGQRGSY